MEAFYERVERPKGKTPAEKAMHSTSLPVHEVGSVPPPAGKPSQQKGQKKQTKKKGKKRTQRSAPAEGTQKPKTTVEPEERKRARKKAVAPSTNAVKHAALQEFKDHSLVAEVTDDGTYLICKACGNKRINCSKKQYVRQHIYGKEGTKVRDAAAWAKLSEAEKEKLLHWKNLKGLQARGERKTALEKATALHREQIFAATDGSKHVKGSTKTTADVSERVEIVLDLWENGVPLSRLDNPSFKRLVEEPHHNIGGREGVRQQIPVAVLSLKEQMRERVKGRYLTVFFDGSKVNECVEAVIVRFVNDELEIEHVCIGASMVTLNMTAATLYTRVRDHLRDAGIEDKHVVYAISDSAAVNPAMVNFWNQLIVELHGDEYDERHLSWLGCLAHGTSNSGTKMRKAAALLKQFFKGFKKMSNTSVAARRVWKDVTKSTCPVLCDNRWWAWYDCAVAVLEHWVKVPEFLGVLQARGISEKSTQKMASILNARGDHWRILELEIRSVVSFGKLFRDACALFEGDGFTLPFVSGVLREMRDLMQTFGLQKLEHPLFVDIRARAREMGMTDYKAKALLEKVVPVVDAALMHFKSSIWQKVGERIPLFDAASLFHPLVFLQQVDDVDFGEQLIKHCETLSSLKGISRDASSFRHLLVAELQSYKTAADALKKDMAQDESLKSPAAIWQWWKSQKTRLKNFFEIARILVLIVPSSAVVERFFSIVKAQTTPQQNAEYADTFGGRAMALFNQNK